MLYLQKEVRRVMYQHHQRADPHIVGTVGETNKEYGGNVMNYLFLEILEHTHEHTVWGDVQKQNHNLSSSAEILKRQIYRLLLYFK